jgi:hypothetical protein
LLRHGTFQYHGAVGAAPRRQRRTIERLGADLAIANGEQAQLLLAKATGNFKRGNERRAD